MSKIMWREACGERDFLSYGVYGGHWFVTESIRVLGFWMQTVALCLVLFLPFTPTIFRVANGDEALGTTVVEHFIVVGSGGLTYALIALLAWVVLALFALLDDFQGELWEIGKHL